MASYLHNLDLCILTYQMYHQSLIWPLDPWYEVMSRKFSDRRDNFMSAVHESAARGDFHPQLYSGPSAIRGWGRSNTDLDPVITAYRSLNPRLPAMTMDGSKFLAIQAPDYITDNIKIVEMATYSARPNDPLTTGVDFREMNRYSNGTDHLIAFEGGTGAKASTSPAWSLMGCVLMRKRKGGKHDIHIIFRGSRSGAAGRALAQAQFKNKGNPDWVSDMSMHMIEDRSVTKVGVVCEGFGLSVKTCFGTIKASLLRLHQEYGAPETVWVTGHSLGAALACLFTSAVAIGTYGDDLRRTALRDWPLNRIVCLPYALPTAGDDRWMKAFDLMVFCRYIWAGNDVVVFGGKVKNLEHVGAGIQLPKPSGAGDNPHETFIIRAAIVDYAQRIRNVKPINPDLVNATPWACHKSFMKMLAGEGCSYKVPGAREPNIITPNNVRDVLRAYNFGDEFDKFLELFKSVIVMPESHRTPVPIVKLTDKAVRVVGRATARNARVSDITGHQGEMQGNWITQGNADAVLNALETELDAFKGSKTDKFIGVGLILTVLEKSQFNSPNLINQLQSRPKIKEYLDTEF